MPSELAPMPREDIALIISVVALLGALTSLFWQVWVPLRVDRPRFRLRLHPDLVLAGGGYQRTVVAVTVTNDGKRPTYLTSLWLGLGKPTYPLYQRVLPPRFRPPFQKAVMIPDYTDPFLAPHLTQIPCRLDVGETAQVFYDRGTVQERLAESEFSTIFGTAGASTARARTHPLELTESQEQVS